MTIAGALIFVAAAAFLGLALRNILGKPSRAALLGGRLSMIAFAALAAYFFWESR